MKTAYSQLMAGTNITLPAKTSSVKQWSERLAEYAAGKALRKEIPYWKELASNRAEKIKSDFQKGENTVKSTAMVSMVLNEEDTGFLLRDANTVYNTQINDLLLTALVRAFKGWNGQSKIWLAMEGHGREDLFDDISLARTAGWFTSMYPVFLDLSQTVETGKSIVMVKEQLRKIPNNGIGFGILKYLTPTGTESLAEMPEPEIVFNYLGQFQTDSAQLGVFKPVAGFIHDERSPKSQRHHLLEISASIKGKNLYFDIIYSKNFFRQESMETFLAIYIKELTDMLSFLQSDKGAYSPSDFQDVDLDEDELGDLLSELVED